jgi:electron transport complex protein RnfG
MNKIVHLGLFLAIVSAVAGGALAFANQMTAPVIAANNEKQEKESLLAMYPDANANDFKLVDAKLDSKTVQNVYIFNMSVSGYKEGTVFLVSIDKDSKKIDKYNAISNGDTKGLGSQVTEAPFKKSLEGKDATGELDTISGATVSSGPVVSGIHEAAKLVDTLK